MIRKGYYTIDEIKSFFIKKVNEDVENIEIGEIIEMRICDDPIIDVVVVVIDIETRLLIAEILEIKGNTEDHEEGDLICIPKELLEW